MAWITTKRNRRGPSYMVQWREPGGRKRSKTFRRKGAANHFKSAVEERLYSGRYVPLARRRTSFRAYAESVLGAEITLAKSTQYHYQGVAEKHLYPILGGMPLDSIGPEDLRSLFAAMGSAKTNTIHSVRNVLSKVLRAAVADGLISSNPLSSIRPPGSSDAQTAFLTPSEVHRLAAVVAPRYRAVILLAAYSGLRIGEMGALTLDDIDFFRQKISVTKSVCKAGSSPFVADTKTSSSRRVIPLPAQVMTEISGHLRRFGAQADGRIFSTATGGLLYGAAMFKPFRRACQQAGLEPIRFHSLRHTAAAIAIDQGIHAKQIQVWLGHKSIKTTLDTYGHLFANVDERLAQQLEAVFSETASNVDTASGSLATVSTL